MPSSAAELIYNDDHVELYYGDCLEFRLDKSIGCIITHPPYIPNRDNEVALLNKIIPKLTNYLCDGGILCTVNTDLRKNSQIRLRHLDIIETCLKSNLKLYDYRIWDKGFGHNLYRIAFSHILAFYKGNRPRIKRPNAIDDILHGKAKFFGKFRDALAGIVTATLINAYSLPGDHIYDPFAGTGTTLLQARNLGRNSTGIEIELEIARIAKRRLTFENEQTSLFG